MLAGAVSSLYDAPPMRKLTDEETVTVAFKAPRSLDDRIAAFGAKCTPRLTKSSAARVVMEIGLADVEATDAAVGSSEPPT